MKRNYFVFFPVPYRRTSRHTADGRAAAHQAPPPPPHRLREMCVVGRALGTGPCALRCPEVAAAFGELVLGRGEALLALPDLEHRST